MKKSFYMVPLGGTFKNGRNQPTLLMEKINYETIILLIEKYQKFPNFSSDAVWNFLGTAHHCGTRANALTNLMYDTELYDWSYGTFRAIMDGLLSK